LNLRGERPPPCNADHLDRLMSRSRCRVPPPLPRAAAAAAAARRLDAPPPLPPRPPLPPAAARHGPPLPTTTRAAAAAVRADHAPPGRRSSCAPANGPTCNYPRPASNSSRRLPTPHEPPIQGLSDAAARSADQLLHRRKESLAPIRVDLFQFIDLETWLFSS
jgi:hypothetical protein